MIKRLRTLIRAGRLDLEAGMFYLHQMTSRVHSWVRNGVYVVRAANGKWAIGRTLFDAVLSLICHLIVCL